MADNDVFKLLTLPSVALRQIIAGVTATDLFELVQSSNKTMQALHYFERGNKIFKMGIDFQRNFVELRNVKKYYSQEIKEGDIFREKKTFDGQEVPIAPGEPNAFNTFWPAGEQKNGTYMIAQHFIKTLGVGTLDQIFISEENSGQEILDWADKYKLVMDSFHLLDAPEDQVLALAERVFSNEFMDKVNINFMSLMKTPEGFKPTRWVTNKVVTMKKFHIQFAHWFTLEHLMCLNVPAVVLYHSTLTSEDINKYLTAWKNGNYREFSYFSFHLNEKVNLADIVKGLVDPREIDTSVHMRETVSFARPCDGKVVYLELEDDSKNFIADVEIQN